MQISIKSTLMELEREMGKLPGKEQRKVIAATLNKAGSKGRTVARRAVARYLGVTQREAFRQGSGRGVFLNRARQTNLVMEVAAVGKPFNLTRFNPVPAGEGMMAVVLGKPRHVPRAFKLPKKGGPIVRRQDNRSRPYPSGHLKSVYGAGVADVLRIKRVQDDVINRVEQSIPDDYERNIRFYFDRMQGRLKRARRR